MKYNFKYIEKYVQNFWEINKTFNVKINNNKKKYYCLSMFPYTSGNIHVGHIRNYTIGDIISRFYRMNNKNVLYPIGWDSFGLPAENAAINNNISPKVWTYKNIIKMKKQLKSLGFSFDWDREISTCSNKYFIYEQYFLKLLYKKKMLYKKYYPVNWCKYDNTVLSNEQVINNKCWRCNSLIYKKNINQWFIKITKYADKLLYDLDKLIYWPNKVKLMQKNWIGKLKWYEIKFYIISTNLKKKYIYIFLNNIYELKNLKYFVISLNNKISKFLFNNNYYNNYFKENNLLKTNIFLYNKFIDKKIDLFISPDDFIVKNFFYKNINNLNVNNKHIKSFDDINNILSIHKYIILNYAFIISNNKIIKINYNSILIKKKIKYNIKDWCISRQRYWGVPIPIAKCINNNFNIIIPKKYLPINLSNYENYLHNNINYNININNNHAIREKDTLDTFIQSSWYYIRYTSPKYNNFIDKKSANYWLPIDQYIGGIEHSTMHLLYFRFFNKLIKDMKFIKYSEPSIRLLCQGMILSKIFYYIKDNKKIWVNYKDIIEKKINNKTKYFFNDIEVYYEGLNKMSKSKNNFVNSDYIVDKYGADTLRIFIIFSAPLKYDFVWNEKNIIGSYRFLNKIWCLVINFINNYKKKINIELNNIEIKLINYINNIINIITNDIKNKQSFNVSISSLMKLTNLISNYVKFNKYNYNFKFKIISILLKLLYPFAPHITFFLWKKLGNNNIIDYESWPTEIYKNLNNSINFLIYINNKFKNKIIINKNLSKNEILKFIIDNKIYNLNNFNIYNENIKIIFIKNKLINILY